MTQVSIPLKDFMNLIEAAKFGIEKGEGFKADFTIRAWKESLENAANTTIDDGKTPEQRTQDWSDDMHDCVAKYGSK
jgi:hypothetical protein